MQMLDLEIAGEFIEMVAYLILIKTRMLLPAPETEGEDEEPEDPRKELALQILEYARFKEMSGRLEVMENNNYYQIPHKAPEIKIEKSPEDEVEISLESFTFYDLLTAFKIALENRPKIFQHEVVKVKVTTEEQSRFILKKLTRKGGPILFRDLMKKIEEKIVVIVTFLSLLDLMKLGFVSVNQTGPFMDFQIVPLKSNLLEEFEKIQRLRVGEKNGEFSETQN
jgi:segregation and condensation protein A